MSKETTPKRIFLISVFRRLTHSGAELVAVIPIDLHRLGLNQGELEFFEKTLLHRMESGQMANAMALGTVTTDFHCMAQKWMPNTAIHCDETNIGKVILTAVHPIVIRGTIVKLYEASLWSKSGGGRKEPHEVIHDLFELQTQIDLWRNPFLSFFSQLSIRIGELRIPQLVPNGKCELDFCPNPV